MSSARDQESAMERLQIIVRIGKWIVRMEVRGVLDSRSVNKAEETLANLKSFRPMPLYINLSNLDDFDSKGFEIFLQILLRFQDSYAYIRIIDSSERYKETLKDLEVEKILDRIFLDLPNQPALCGNWMRLNEAGPSGKEARIWAVLRRFSLRWMDHGAALFASCIVP